MAGETKLYHDVDVVERTEVTPVGKVVKVYRVSAYTKKDTYFTITVPEQDFSKEKVDKLLTEKAKLLESVTEL